MTSATTPEGLLSAFARRGFAIRSVGGRLGISPASALTHADRAILRERRDALLAALTLGEPWDQREALRLMEEADALVQRLAVNGGNLAVVDAAAMVASAFATRDMETVRFACTEFAATVRGLVSRRNL